jgi:hypothetical protein
MRRIEDAMRRNNRKARSTTTASTDAMTRSWKYGALYELADIIAGHRPVAVRAASSQRRATIV